MKRRKELINYHVGYLMDKWYCYSIEPCTMLFNWRFDKQTNRKTIKSIDLMLIKELSNGKWWDAQTWKENLNHDEESKEQN